MQKKESQKRVLILTYYWPPCGGVSVLFGLKLTKYLREFGWEPVVYAPENPDYPYEDPKNEQEIPENISILKHRIREPSSLFRKIKGAKTNEKASQNIFSNQEERQSFKERLSFWIRGNFFIPDSRAFWIRPSVSFLSDYLANHKVDALLTNAPPHTVSVIGMKLSKRFGIPLLAHFRDPWTQVDYYKKLRIGKRADKKQKRLEQQLFDTARLITIASPGWKEDLKSIGAKRVEVVYTGYDEADFSDFQRKRDPVHFTIFHAGLLGDDRDLSSFFAFLAQLPPEVKDKIQIRLAGKVGVLNRRALEENKLMEQTELLGNISRDEVFSIYEKSGLLLLPINRAENQKGRIPAKLFEYLRTGVPLLAFGPRDSDAGSIILEKEAGTIVGYEASSKELPSFFKTVFQSWEQGFSEGKERSLQEFSNYELTKKVARYLDEIVQ